MTRSLCSLFLIAYFVTFLLVATSAEDYNDTWFRTDNDDDDQVCVTLEKYGDGCKGKVQSTNTFTALTHPGSPCKHTANMKSNSAKDQYCDSDGVFHQKVYIQNTHCKVGWEQKAFSPMHLTYTQDKCTYGYKLKSCTPGPCDEDSPNLLLLDDEVTLLVDDSESMTATSVERRLLRTHNEYAE